MKRLNWFVKVVFSIFWEKNKLCIIYDSWWNQGHIQGKIEQWNIYERSIFIKKNQNRITYIYYRNSKSLENSIDIPVYRYSVLV